MNLDLLRQRLARPTALAVIDVQVDFCSPDGWRAKNGGDLSYMDAAIDNILLLTEVRRYFDRGVFYTKQVYAKNMLTERQKMQFEREERAIVCNQATGGDAFYRVKPGMSPVYHKVSFDIFEVPELESDLSAVETLILTGVDTQICIENAARSAFNRGFSVIVVSDAVASSGKSRHFHDNSLKLIEKNFGLVCTTQELLTCLRESA